MSCGCQDKENDALIIEHYNKKKMTEIENAEIQNVIHITWQGFLHEYSIYIPDESIILSIEKRDGWWIAKCIEQF